jgi:hypothetical protein
MRGVIVASLIQVWLAGRHMAEGAGFSLCLRILRLGVGRGYTGAPRCERVSRQLATFAPAIVLSLSESNDYRQPDRYFPMKVGILWNRRGKCSDACEVNLCADLHF